MAGRLSFLTAEVIDKLLCRPSGEAAVVQLPLICLEKKLLLGHIDVIFLRQGPHDVLECLLIRRAEIDRHTETVYQGKLLLNGIVCVKLLVPVLLVFEGLPYQMTAVTGGVDQDIVRLPFQTAFDDCLQIFVFDLKFFKRQIVHVNDEAVVPVFDLSDDLVQILELMLVNLDDS